MFFLSIGNIRNECLFFWVHEELIEAQEAPSDYRAICLFQTQIFPDESRKKTFIPLYDFTWQLIFEVPLSCFKRLNSDQQYLLDIFLQKY